MPEEVLVALAQVMKSRIPVRGGREAVLRAAAVAREPDIALPAVCRQCVSFGVAERLLLRRGHELKQVSLPDVPQEIVRLDKMVTRVQIPVVLQGHSRAAGLAVYTQ